MQLTIIRHGQTQLDVQKDLGTQDPPLSELGLRQARLAGQRVAQARPDVFYCGPSSRNLDTAQCIHDACGVRATLLWPVFEVGANQDLLTWEEINKKYPFVQDQADCPAWQSDKAESREEGFDRAYSVLAWLREKHGGEDTAVTVVGHGTFLSMFLARCINAPYAHYTQFSAGNCSFHTMAVHPDRVRILKHNCESHLPEDART